MIVETHYERDNPEALAEEHEEFLARQPVIVLNTVEENNLVDTLIKDKVSAGLRRAKARGDRSAGAHQREGMTRESQHKRAATAGAGLPDQSAEQGAVAGVDSVEHPDSGHAWTLWRGRTHLGAAAS